MCKNTLRERWNVISRNSILLDKVLAILTGLYVIFIQLPLLSPYRLIPADEVQLIDYAFHIASGEGIVPAGPIWSHVLPHTGVYFAAYPPLYFYLAALWLKIIGFGPVSIGLLHAVLRLTSAVIFFNVCRHLRCGKLGYFFTCLWATFAIGPVGRYEDLALVFLLASVYCLSAPRHGRYRDFWAGILIGCALLAYLSPLIPLIPFGVVAIQHLNEPVIGSDIQILPMANSSNWTLGLSHGSGMAFLDYSILE